jgi:hypothetical protein
MTRFDRHYRLPPPVQLLVRGMSVASLPVELAFPLLEPAGFPWAPFTVAWYVLTAFQAVRGERLIRRGGTYETEETIRLGSNTAARHVCWRDRAAFEQVNGTRRVAVRMRDGTAQPANNLQGSRIVWNGGETKDIISVLNERAATWRLEHDCPAWAPNAAPAAAAQ